MTILAQPLLLAAILFTTPADTWPPSSDLPEGVLATIDGDPLGEEEFYERLVEARASSSDTPGVLQQLIDTRLIAAEMARRGLTVTLDEVDERFDALAKQMAEQTQGATTLEATLEAQGVTVKLFRSKLEFLVGLERLAREDFGITDPNEALPQSKLNLWLAQLRENAGIVTEGLPDGVVARTDGFNVTEVDLGKALAELEEPDYLARLLRAMVSEELIQRTLEAEKLTIEPDDLQAEMDFRRWAYNRVERYEGVEFDQYLTATQGMDAAAIQQTVNYRYQVALKKIIKHTVDESVLREHFEKNKQNYGPLRRARHLLISTQNRTQTEAVEKFDKIREEIDAGVPFASMVKQHSDASDREQGGDTGYFPITRPLDPALIDAVFSLEPGEISAPVVTTRGIEMIQVIGIKPLPSFEEIEGQILRELALEWLDERRQSADVKPAWLFRKPTNEPATTPEESQSKSAPASGPSPENG